MALSSKKKCSCHYSGDYSKGIVTNLSGLSKPRCQSRIIKIQTAERIMSTSFSTAESIVVSLALFSRSPKLNLRQLTSMSMLMPTNEFPQYLLRESKRGYMCMTDQTPLYIE